MQEKKNNKYAAIKLRRLGNLFIVFSLLITLPFTTMPSSGKYVLEPIIDTTSLHSSETYTVLSIGEVAGTAQVEQTLTAGTLSPVAATVDYQWQKSISPGGTYTDIPGATSDTYSLAGNDEGYYIRVTATGKDSYTGTVTSPYTGPVAACPVTDIGGISGVAQIGQNLTAGTLTPAGAIVDYQWQRASESGDVYTDIPGATANTYSLTAGDQDYYIKVTATGRDGYTGTTTSPYTGPVTAIPITAIGATGGTAQIGQVLSAGTVTPLGATVNYQWQRASESGGIYTDIPGATASTYTLSADDTGGYIIVRATGTGSYTGTVSSSYKGPVGAGQITAIGPISGTAAIGETLTAGTLTPFGATAAYQWQRSNGSNPFADIPGATMSTYALTGSDSNCYIRVAATGTGGYTGTVISEYVGRVGAVIIPLTSFGEISGAAEVGQVLTAGILSPVGATVTYQWQRCDTAEGTYEIIPGATVNGYTLTPADKDKYIKVTAIGSGTYSGTLTSGFKGPVAAGQIAIGQISGTTAVGQILTAGTLSPLNATVTYQWLRCTTTNGTYETIPGANSNTYTLTAGDEGYFIKVAATGTGAYTGTASSEYTGPVGITITPVNAIGAISGTAQVTQPLTAGTVNPSGATVTYQWLRCNTAEGTYESIPGATTNTYTLTAADMNQYIKVQASGSGTYSGTVTSTCKGPVAAGQITAIGPISGTTSVGQVLTVGTLTPYGATAAYQWQRSNGTSPFTDIVGGEASSYTLTGMDSYCYMRVVATGTGAYTGTVISDYVGRVGAVITPLTSIGAIGGTEAIGQTLTAGILSPTGAIATYQWQRADTADGIYGIIAGATANSYTLTPADKDKYIKVAAIGSGNYSGMVLSSYKGPVAAGQITAIGTINGTTSVGQTLTSGTLTPPNATVTYQWQRCAVTNGTYENITNANASTYTLKAADEGYFIKVVVTGTGAYSGTVISEYTGPVGITVTPVTAIGAISGTAQVTQTLTAGTVSPSGATVTYQWLRCATAEGTYENIPGATSNAYTLAAGEKDHYIKVQITGAGAYSGMATSTYKGPVAAGQITAIGPISGTTSVGQTLAVGTLTPFGATAVYQWQRSDGDGPFADIIGGTSSTYTLTGLDSYRYIRVVATGTGAFTGTVISDFVGRVGASVTPLTSIGEISGTAEVGQILTAGTLTPAGSATYQWQRCAAADGIYENIPGATGKSYILTAADKDKYIKVSAIGAGNYSGMVVSASKGPVAAGQITAIGAINGTTTVGQTLSAGTLTPHNVTVTYQWQRCTVTNGTYENITNANASTYTLKADDEGYFIKVVATATGAYTGTVTSEYTGPTGITMTPVTAIGTISGTARVAQTLTAGTVSPLGASVTYQWQRCIASDGTYENIPGATSNFYLLTAGEKDHYIRVQVTGSGSYSGTVISASKGPVAAGQITAIGAISGTTSVGQTLTVGTLMPYGSTASYQWQRSDGNSPFTDIVGGTSSTYTLTGPDSYRYIRVAATGTGAYTGTVYSAQVGRVGNPVTPLTGIEAIDGTAEVGQVLSAGTLSPTGTATYQWQRADTPGGVYGYISGATADSYTLTAADKDKYIKVTATGNGNYSGTVTSAYKGPVSAGQLTAIGAISGTTAVGQTLAAGTLAPFRATVVYQWQRCDTVNGIYEDIMNATANSYTLKAADAGYYIKVIAAGTGAYTGTASSIPTGPAGIATTPVTAIGTISGTAQVGMVLTAGTVDPLGATVTYQWQKSDTDVGVYEDIPGATSDTYSLTAAEKDHYIRVEVTGSGSCSGTVASAYLGPVGAGQITAISNITGTTAAGQTLTAGIVSPLGATVTYQWLRAGSPGGSYSNIGGATSNTYSLSSADNGSYIKVKAIGTDAYTGTVISSYTGPVSGAFTELTAIGAINGLPEVGQTLTAGTLNPLAATATYQWQRCATSDGEYVNIPGAVSNTYNISGSDADKYLRVRATGSGNYTGTVTSGQTGPVTAGMFMMMMLLMEETVPITAIDAISGTVQVGRTLEAGTLSPSDAEVTYQWQSCDTADGVFENIAGADASTYMPSDRDETKYIQVVVTGTGAYTGTVTSAIIGPVEPRTTITAIDAIRGIAQVSRALEAGSLSPSDAEGTYQWQSCETADGTFENIAGANTGTFTLSDGEEAKYIQVIVTGTGAYTGTLISAVIGPVEPRTPIATIDAISGKAQVGRTLEAGTLSPFDGTVRYQWQSCDIADGAFENIAGANTGTFTLSNGEEAKYIQVIVTGTGAYTGTVTSAVIGPVEPRTPITAIDGIGGTAQVGRTLEAASLSPSDATVTYQWQSCDTADGVFENIPGADAGTYDLTDREEAKCIRVVVTGTGAFTGTVTSAVIGPVEPRTPITAIDAISGNARAEQTVEAGGLNPSDATATYQWQRCDTADGAFIDIAGAASSTYTLGADDFNYFIRVTATGTGSFTGAVSSEPTAQIGPATINIAEITGVKVPEKDKRPDSAVQDTRQYTAVISWSPDDEAFRNNEAYTATITITPKTGYTLEGLPADFFTVEGAVSVINSADSGVVIVVFPVVFEEEPEGIEEEPEGIEEEPEGIEEEPEEAAEPQGDTKDVSEVTETFPI